VAIIVGFREKKLVVRPLLRVWNVCDSFDEVIRSGRCSAPNLQLNVMIIDNTFSDLNELLWTNEIKLGKFRLNLN
jgi:hypothetical protein